MRQAGFWRGFFVALTLAVGLYAVQGIAGGQVQMSYPEAEAIGRLTQEVRLLRTQGIPVQVKFADAPKMRLEGPVQITTGSGELRVRTTN